MENSGNAMFFKNMPNSLISRQVSLIICIFLGILTFANFGRLLDIAPINVYLVYALIGCLFTLAIYAFRTSYRFRKNWRYYFLFLVCCSFLGFYNENPNVFVDLRFYALGLVVLIVASEPKVVFGVMNIKNRTLDIILGLNIGAALIFEVMLKGLIYAGYGLGVPAYLFAFYMARGEKLRAAVSFALVIHQQKRSFILASLILLFVVPAIKRRYWPVYLSLLLFGLFVFTNYSLIGLADLEGVSSFADRISTLNPFSTRYDIEIAGAGRKAELDAALGGMAGADWVLGNGLGFEFTRYKLWKDVFITDGYTHISAFNFYLIGGIAGAILISAVMLRSVIGWRKFYSTTGRSEFLYISLLAYTASFFSFLAAVDPLFWFSMSYSTMLIQHYRQYNYSNS